VPLPALPLASLLSTVRRDSPDLPGDARARRCIGFAPAAGRLEMKPIAGYRAPKVAGGRQQADSTRDAAHLLPYPLIPVMVIPSVKYRWANKNTTMQGIEIMKAPAI